MDQNTARTLAREVGTRATTLGCRPSNADNPTLSQLAEECDALGIDLHEVLSHC